LQLGAGLAVVPGSLSIPATVELSEGGWGILEGPAVNVGSEPSAVVTYDVRLTVAGV
jgi:hypothetical protein